MSQETQDRGRKDLWTLIREDKEREKTQGVAGEGANSTNDELTSYESMVLIAGAASGGKSSLVHRFLERSDPPQSSIGLEYTFGRRTKGVTSVKDLTHIWELAGGTKLLELLKIPISESTIHALTLFVVADLSGPWTVLDTLKPTLEKFSSTINGILDGLERRGSRRPKGMRANALKKYGPEHPDRERVTPLPVPVVIVGTKYDIFRDIAPDKRKIITRALRHLAHLYGASLLYTSTKEETLMLRARQVFTHHAFKANCPKGFVTDYNKPAFILAGSDSFEQIVGPHPARADDVISVGTAASFQHDFDRLKIELTSLYPAKSNATAALDLSKYPEPEVDKVKMHKDDELERYRLNMQRKSKEVKAALASEKSTVNTKSRGRAAAV